MWDLYDSANESFDNVNWSYQYWWFYTTRPGIYTLEDFVQRMSNNYSEMRGDIASILEEHMISPKITNVSTYSATTPPTITFQVNGSEAHPNNRFVVYFYDESGNYLGESEMIESSVGHFDSITHNVLSDLWENIIDAANIDCGVNAKINISIGGYRYDDTWVSDSSRALSGPYFSSYEELQILIDHSYELQMGDDISHKYVCARCSHTITEEHNTMMQAVSGNQHAEECWDCGYIDESTREAHSFDGWVFINETTHMSRCECGARGTTTASHVFTLPDKIAGRMICRGCGYTKYSGSGDGFIIMSNTKMSVNGSYILPDGNIVLVDEDVEAYLNGTLVFYDKDKLPITQ